MATGSIYNVYIYAHIYIYICNVVRDSINVAKTTVVLRDRQHIYIYENVRYYVHYHHYTCISSGVAKPKKNWEKLRTELKTPNEEKNSNWNLKFRTEFKIPIEEKNPKE